MPITRAMGSASSSRTPLPTSPKRKPKSKAGPTTTPSAAPKTVAPYFSRATTGVGAAPAITTPAPPQGAADASPASNFKLGRRGVPKRRLDQSPGPRPSSPQKQRRVTQASSSADSNEESYANTSASASRSAEPNAQPTAQAALDAIPDLKGDVGNTSLSQISTPSASVFSKEHASARDSLNTSHGSLELPAKKQEDGAQTKPDLVEELHTQFRQFPTGEIAYGHALQTRVLPQIRFKDIGLFNLPLDTQQLAEIRKYAFEPYAGKFGVDWPFNTAHRLTSSIPPESFEIMNSEEWNAQVGQLAINAGMYLGFGPMSAKIEFKPGSLYLWEKDDVWRGYSRPPKEDRDKWIGTIVLIMQQDCKGGEVAARYRSKDMLLDPGMRGSFLIASHSSTLVDPMPLSNGYRLALTYELFLAENPFKDSFLDKLVTQSQISESEVLKGLKTWASRIEQGKMENFPLIHVLEGHYEQKDMYIGALNAEDRSLAMAAIKATYNPNLTPRPDYAFGAYLVMVKATSKNYSARSRVRYSIEWAATIDGILVPGIKATIVDEKGVLQKDKFEDGETSRQVTKTMHTTTKTVACMMYIWEAVKRH